ncbi:MAG: hypothetical protein NC123_16690 [Butyrivibrio sp.]|nr:hypothetical protein [Acetatifactor muris]MCM1561156.1 hypothetical protein [Butyrivibrio sp.]
MGKAMKKGTGREIKKNGQKKSRIVTLCAAAVCMMLCACGAADTNGTAGMPQGMIRENDAGQKGGNGAQEHDTMPETDAGASGEGMNPAEGMGSAEGDRGLEEKQQRDSDHISGEEVIPGRQDYHLEAFGGNVYFFAPEDDPEEVQGILEAIWKKQEKNQFGDDRYAVYFLPGVYDEKIRAKVGFYTQIAGLGASPDDVSLYDLTCDARWLGDNKNHNATCNFWRGVENLSVREYATWAVSQATFMRRVHIGKTIYLHDSNGWASGGFLADSKVELAVNSGTQQQWLSRNCDWSTWIGENWNMVFAGIEAGKTPEGTWPEHAYTDVPVVDCIREKPFLTYDEERGFGVYLPEIRTEAVGTDWNPGEFLPMETFYIAGAETDTAETMNRALAEGKNLFLTPGVYELDAALAVDREGTVILGTGLATLCSMKGNSCMEVTGGGVTVAGILFDAGPESTEHLLAVGEKSADDSRETADEAVAGESQAAGSRKTAAGGEAADSRTATDSGEAVGGGETTPGVTLLADLFFRVGGAKNYDTEVDCCVELHQDGVIGDNFWVWRADHGSGVGWRRNRARNGIRVTGDDVTIYALMVEHFQEYQTIWEGENGEVVFYQCEIPYDVPSQEEWVSHDGAVNGFASYKVADTVESHRACGLGIYLYNRDATVELHSAMEIPEEAEGILVHHICTVMITGNPGITHIINEQGDAVVTPGARAVILER